MAGAVPRRARPRARLFVAAAVAVLALPPAVPAHADPTPAQIEDQITNAWNRLEPVVEQYDEVHAQLAADRARIQDLRERLAPLQMLVDLTMARVGAMSAQLYERGPGGRLVALLSSGGPDTLANRLTTLDELARRETAQVADAIALRDRYLATKAPLDRLEARLAVRAADLDNRRRVIQAQLNDLQRLRLAAYGAGGPALGELRPVPCPLVYLGDRGSRAAKRACAAIGKPYVWAAAGPRGYDCSGLALAAWGSVGVALGHFTGWQWFEGARVTRAELRPGDLVFYYRDEHHVAVYVGGDWVVHAPHPGDFVRMARLDSMPVDGFRRPGG